MGEGDDRLSELHHTIVKLSRNGEIIVLDTGAVIPPESEAMLQALHSRSTGGLRSHLEVLAKKGPQGFMKNFYVGYGHKSIGDCASTTVFIEGVSMLAAKAVQDSPLYRGQEASTRYVDFSKQPFIDPTRTPEGQALLEMQRASYMAAQEPTRVNLRRVYPPVAGEDESKWHKAIDARAFDITRSLLPAGAATNLAWHVDLRHAADRILFLRHHPLAEVRDIAQGLEEALMKAHPNSFGHKRYDATEAYQELIAEHYYHHDKNCPQGPIVDFSKIDGNGLLESLDLFQYRPKKTELPKFLAQLGTLDVSFLLDFGSFRDIQRHRAIIQRMPLLTTELGFNQWYVENFPFEIRNELPEYLDTVVSGIESLGLSPEESQYFTPMGYNVSNRFTGDLPAIVYMVELRDSSVVHPTLQKVAHNVGQQITSNLGIPLHTDPQPSRFNIKRGEHDIVLRD